MLFYRLFQFHKGTIKTCMIIVAIFVKFLFQFHKGTIKTGLVSATLPAS